MHDYTCRFIFLSTRQGLARNLVLINKINTQIQAWGETIQPLSLAPYLMAPQSHQNEIKIMLYPSLTPPTLSHRPLNPNHAEPCPRKEKNLDRLRVQPRCMSILHVCSSKILYIINSGQPLDQLARYPPKNRQQAPPSSSNSCPSIP